MLTTNGLSHREMAYMCSKCVWFHFVWKEPWVCFYLRKEHGMHMHSFLKWETLIECNRSFVWAGNSELSSMGDDFGFSGQDFRVYLPNSLGLSVQHQARGTFASVILCNYGLISGAKSLHTFQFHLFNLGPWHTQLLTAQGECVPVCG